ncbi:Uncharacterised protein [Haemophilus parahaemolyticus HK385]|uniref:Uncharacterized protein n=1 Tax=Haemophilus parahaemolyticus HK385 TaxID=1095744 RepID=A0ABN0F0Z8_HAEPH|nr:hypothetical protein HMPREF1050_1302 [Haemophilus parahaemolyticus HK385]OOR95385.1 hypothetical protein B0185_08190 [Haemophilus parahaemolyticus]STO66647.1 Uncharacterised protein [Haemophilus parahaemolyticus HK385]
MCQSEKFVNDFLLRFGKYFFWFIIFPPHKFSTREKINFMLFYNVIFLTDFGRIRKKDIFNLTH